MALPTEADQESKLNGLSKGLGRKRLIEFQYVSASAPKPLEINARQRSPTRGRSIDPVVCAQFRDGKFVNSRCFSFDCTPLKHAREDARRKDELFRQVLEALPAAVYTTDAAGKITYFNRAAAELAGREPEVGKDGWCVTFRLFTPDGQELQPNIFKILKCGCTGAQLARPALG